MNNQEKGGMANHIGRYIAGEIADFMGANLKGNSSNECFLGGKHCVIKTARCGNRLFGVTKKMHDKLDMIILAVEGKLHEFDIYGIPLDHLENECITTGENSGKGKVISYDVIHAISLGSKIARIKVDLSEFDAQ